MQPQTKNSNRANNSSTQKSQIIVKANGRMIDLSPLVCFIENLDLNKEDGNEVCLEMDVVIAKTLSGYKEEDFAGDLRSSLQLLRGLKDMLRCVLTPVA